MKTIKRYLVPLMVFFLLLVAAVADAHVYIQCPPDTDNIDSDGDGIVDNDHLCIHLAAGDGFIKMADGKLQYMFGYSNVTGVPEDGVMMEGMLAAEFPAPTIKAKEGQKVYLTLTNVGMMMRPDLFDPHSLHWHGFPNAATVFDGEPMGSISVNMGASLTYFYQPYEPGTYLYHCHVEATEHMQMGMLGNLWLMPMQDGPALTYQGRAYTKFAYNDGDGSTGYDVDYPVQMHAFDSNFHEKHIAIQPLPFAMMKDDYPMLNGRGYPDTINPLPLAAPAENGGKASQKVSTLITATRGQRILLRISNLATIDHYTLTVLGIPMLVVGKDARLLRSPTGENLYYETSSVNLGGGETFDVILETANVPAGTYFLYTTNLHHLNNGTEDFGGMLTEIVIN